MVSWWPRYGFWGSTLAACSRALWLLPLLALLAPIAPQQSALVSLGRAMRSMPLWMTPLACSTLPPRIVRPRSLAKGHSSSRGTRGVFAAGKSCNLKVVYGSEQHRGFLQQLTPLQHVIPPWPRGPRQEASLVNL